MKLPLYYNAISKNQEIFVHYHIINKMYAPGNICKTNNWFEVYIYNTDSRISSEYIYNKNT